MRIIILGYTSFVGRALSDYFRSIKDVELLHVGREDSNLHKVIKFEVVNDIKLLDNAVSNLIDSLDLNNKSVVINCISMGDLDKCELNQEDCEMENYHFVTSYRSYVLNGLLVGRLSIWRRIAILYFLFQWT